MHEVVNEREKDAKVKMKSMYDKRAKERELVEGQMVLTKIPRLGNKLDDAWDGPYEVIRKISNTNYEIAVPHNHAKTKIVHINNLKTWKQEEARVYRIVVAADDMPDLADGLKLHGSVATATQLEQLAIIKRILQKFPGKIESEEISINTVIWRCQTPTRALCATAQKESGEVPIPNPYGLQESCSSDTYLAGL